MRAIVVGGGVMGCALARELAQRGAAITLVEAAPDLAQGCTGAAIGTLSYSPGGPQPPGWHALAREALAAHRALAGALQRERPGLAPTWHWPGRLDVATSNHAEQHSRARLRADLTAGEAGTWLDKRAAHEREPLLAGRVQGASFREGQGWVDAEALTRALAASAAEAGAVLRLNCAVAALLWEGERVVGVAAGGAALRAEAVIVAAGVASAHLDTRLPLPLTPVRGQALHLDLADSPLPQPPIRHLIVGSGIYLIPDGAGVSVGSTHERGVGQRGNSAAGVAKLLGNAVALFPALGVADWQRVRLWSGLRPATPDEVPILGPDPRAPGLWWATGHFRSGVLLAPGSAALLADALLRQAPLDPRWGVARLL